MPKRERKSKVLVDKKAKIGIKVEPAPRNIFADRVDPVHKQINLMEQQLVAEVWASKYRYGDELNPMESFLRVANAIYAKDTDEHGQQAYDAMVAGLFMPGGRIIAGAGTGNRVTLMNCYVNRRLDDSLDDIMRGVSDAALTQQQGGGIGTDFSTLRPAGAILQRTGA